MLPLRSYVPSLALALSLASVCEAQPVRTTHLTHSVAELAEPFSSVSSLVELSDGRVLVADATEKAVRVVDFASGAVRQIGREGNGPREYTRPSLLVPLGGDTVLIRDASRYLVVAPNAQLTDRTLASPSILMMTPKGVDRRGNLYFQAPLYDARTQQMRDSVPVFRVNLATGRTDTLAWVQVRSSTDPKQERIAGGGRRMGIRSSPYQPADVWTVLADGTLLIARVTDYHVDIVAPDGARRAGPRIPFPQQPVPTEAREFMPELPRTKPPFVHSSSPMARSTPAGVFWIPRTPPRPGDPERHDLVDREGRLIRQVVLPPGTRLAGFGARWLYLVREDADGLQYLQRFAYPA